MIKCLLIGPCGVGKSSLGLKLAKELHLEFIDLDNYIQKTYRIQNLADSLAQGGSDAFYQASLNCLNKIHIQEADSIVSAGAGTQYAAQTDLELLNYPNVCLWAEPIYLWRKNQILRQDPRQFEYFKSIEFHPFRKALYQQAQFFLDVTQLNHKESFLKLLEILRAFI